MARTAAQRVGPSAKIAALDLNPDMLAVARTAAGRDGLDIDWHEGHAEAMPFPDSVFDLVFCQFALMFFSSRSAAVTEMSRVLAPGGRVAISVFQAIEKHPFYVALDNVIQGHIGASGVGDIFALGDEDYLRMLLKDAGFQDIRIEPASMTARFPNPEGFIAGEIDVDTASIPSMQRLGDDERRALISAVRQDMEKPLNDVTKEEHVILPFHACVVSARTAST